MNDVSYPHPPYVDIGQGILIYHDWFDEELLSGNGKGGVVSWEYVEKEIAQTNDSWAQACLIIKIIEMKPVPAPNDNNNMSILNDGEVEIDTEVAHIFNNLPSDDDVLDVVYSGGITNSYGTDDSGFSCPPSDQDIKHGSKGLILISAGEPITKRTLAHELGHVLTNHDHNAADEVPSYLFFPTANAWISTEDDENIVTGRRITAAVESMARTLLPENDFMGIGNKYIDVWIGD